MREVAPSAGQTIRITGRGDAICLSQNGCRINLSEADVLPVFDAVAEVIADNRRFAENHEKARHRPRKGKAHEEEQHAEASAE